jgi:alpha-L-fucosidase 2
MATWGVTAAICEMPVQSHAGEISFLPAVPKEWKRGSFSGLVVRGGFEVGARWDEEGLSEALIHSRGGGIVRLRLPVEVNVIRLMDESGGSTTTVKAEPNGLFLSTAKTGSRYRIDW